MKKSNAKLIKSNLLIDYFKDSIKECNIIQLKKAIDNLDLNLQDNNKISLIHYYCLRSSDHLLPLSKKIPNY